MARKPSTILFDLVKSMTVEECQFFYDYTHLYQGDNKYLELFELLKKQTVYDETSLKESLYGIDNKGNQFAVLKRYLYDELLRSLAIYHDKQCHYVYFQERLQHITLLLEKDLLEDALELLNNLEKKATTTEQSLLLLKVLHSKQKLSYLYLAKKAYFDQRVSFTIPFETLEKTEIDRLLFSEVFTKMQKEAILRDPILKDKLQIISATSFKPHITYEQTLLNGLIISYNLYALGDFEILFQKSKQLLKYIEQVPKYIEQDVLYTMSTLNNCVISAINLYQYEKGLRYLDKLQVLPNKLPNRETLVLKSYYTIYLSCYVAMGNLQRASNVLKHIKKQPEQEALLSFAPIQFYGATIYIGLNDYDKALFFLNSITEQERGKGRSDIQSIARILTLIAHYELDNHFILEYQMRNAARFLKKQRRYLTFERFFIRVINALLNAIDAQPVLEKYYQKFKALQNSLKNINITTHYFDFDIWFRSKLEKRSFEVLSKEKYDKLKESIDET